MFVPYSTCVVAGAFVIQEMTADDVVIFAVVMAEMTGGIASMTVTVTFAVAPPEALAAVNVYVVVVTGATCTDARLETFPTSLSILNDVAPETFHDNTAAPPAVMAAGDATKDVMIGAVAGAVASGAYSRIAASPARSAALVVGLPVVPSACKGYQGPPVQFGYVPWMQTGFDGVSTSLSGTPL